MSFQKWKKKKEKSVSEGNLDEMFTSCSELAELYASKGEFDNALQEYKEAKRAAEAAYNTIRVAVAHRMIGEVYSSMQNYDLAIKHQLKYLELARVQENLVEEQRALANLGHMYLLKADTFTNPQSNEKQQTLGQAKKYSLLSLQVCEKLTNINKKELIEMQARLYLNLGLTVEQQNEAETAANYFNRAISLCKSMDIWEILYRSHNSLACLCQHQNNPTQAIQHCDKALSIAQRLEDKNQRICDLLLLKADVLFDLPDFRGAKQCLLKAYKLNTNNCDEVEKRLRTVAAICRYEEQLLNTPDCDLTTKKSLYECLGDGCAALKSFSKALEYYYLMLETAKNLGETGEQLRPCYVSLSQTYKDNKQYDLAIKYFNEELSLNTNNPLEACKTTLSVADALEIKESECEEVLAVYQEARRFAQAANDHRLEAKALSSMVQLLNDNNRISDSRKFQAELDHLKEKFGPLPSSSDSEGEEENTPEIGADICIDELSDVELEDDTLNNARTRKKNVVTKFRRNEKGEYPLHTACIDGNLTLVKKLLDQGHPVNVRDHNGWLPLHEACNLGHLEVVEELLDRGASINDRGSDGCDGLTPLLDAACCGNFSVIRLLLRRGASPVMRSNRGESVLDCLVAWRKRYMEQMNSDLEPESMREYNDLVKTFRAALQKTGQKPETEHRPPSPLRLSGHKMSRRHSGHESREKNIHKPGRSSSSRRSAEDDNLQSWRSHAERDPGPKSSSSLRRSTDDILSQQSTVNNAAKEYEDAMKGLRRKPAPAQSSSSPEADERSALVSEVVEDWLVDDLGPSGSRGTKRRRPPLCEGQPQRKSNRQTSPHRWRGLRPISPVNQLSDSNDSVINQPIVSSEQNEDFPEQTEIVSSDEQTSQEHNRQQSASAKRTTQLPLSVFGVVSTTMTRQSEPEVFLPVTSQAAYPPATQPPSNSQMAPPSIKVRVEGKLLLIPLPTQTEEPLTIAWLANEAAQRYYSFEGVEPRLSLRTEDGALLAPQDPVSLLLSYREVTGIVTSWRQHPVTERYRQACADLATEPDEYLERCLDISQASFSLSLQGCCLDATLVEPVFRACTSQTALQHLILSDNRLGDASMQLLAKLIIKLPHLRELDLSCNGITSEGLNLLAHQVSQHQACKRLETLVLSHNRLGQSCVGALSQLLLVAKSVASLSLACVGLTAASFLGSHHLSLERLERLDLSQNKLGGEAVRAVLRAVSVSRLVCLRLAHCGDGVAQAVSDWLATGLPCQLLTLDLAYCTDNSHTFTRLIRSLERVPQLEHLELSPEMAEEETLQTLYRLPLKVLRLPGVQVTIPPPRPPPTLQLSCLSLSCPTWASQGPFGLISNH